MDPFLDIATSLHNHSLTLLVGTGFSLYLTDNSAPRWTKLLYELTEKIDDSTQNLTEQFFEATTIRTDNPQLNKLDILVCSQILELEYRKQDKDIRKEVCEIIREATANDKISEDRISELRNFFTEHPDINIVTTNYDTLLSDYLLNDSRIFLEGNPIPQINTTRNIYHIHGSITCPDSIVLTLSDYFRFQNSTGYLSNKFYTLLHETCVVILGYSLGDFNLNSILNQAKQQRPESFCGADIYYVSRHTVSPILKEFYRDAYGITVIEECPIDEFFNRVDECYSRAVELIRKVDNLPEILKDHALYPKELISRHDSLNGVFALANRHRIEIDNSDFHRFLLYLLRQKQVLTGRYNAWDQYVHLADWLLEIAYTINISESPIKEEFLAIARHSLRHSSKRWIRGYSWYAYGVWQQRFQTLLPANRELLQTIITDLCPSCPLQDLDQIIT